MSLTISYPSTLTLSTYIYTTGYTARNSPIKKLLLPTDLVMQPIASTYIVDNEIWCPNPTSVTFPANPFTDITYQIGSGASTSSSAVSLSISTPASCTDLLFLYSAKMSTGAVLPSFISYS